MISDYCQIADDIPNLVTDVLSKLVDILKVQFFIFDFFQPCNSYFNCIYNFYSSLIVELVNLYSEQVQLKWLD